MTRPYKLLKAETEDSVMMKKEVKTGMAPENSMKYKIYKIINQSKHPLLLNEIIEMIDINTPRRSYEKVAQDLSVSKLISRTKCTCGTAYIYSSIK